MSIQYGPPRTATTLQEFAVKFALKVMHPEAEIQDFFLFQAGGHPPSIPSPSVYYVFNTHEDEWLKNKLLWPAAWQDELSKAALFVTSDSGSKTWQDAVR